MILLPSVLVLLVSELAVTSHFAFRNNAATSMTQPFPCPVPCGDGWCCDNDQTCHVATFGDTPYVCEDLLLTQTDGYSSLLLPSISQLHIASSLTANQK
jgi:hypothetical protein